MANPKQRYLNDDYLQANPTWDVEDSGWKARQVYDLIEKLQLPVGRVCEVGCGAGGVLRELRARLQDAQLTGYDISPAAASFWNGPDNAGIEFRVGDLATSGNEKYNLILLLDVLEHVNDPHQLLEGLRDRADYFVFHFPLDLSALSVLRETPLLHVRRKVGHIHYFTKALALELLDEAGFEIFEARYSGAYRNAPQRGLLGKVAGLFRWMVQGISRDFGVRLLGGETLYVVAKPNAEKY